MSVCVDREEIDQTHNADRNEECERARERSERARAKREKTKNSRKNEKMRKYDLDERDRWIKEKSNSRTVTSSPPLDATHSCELESTIAIRDEKHFKSS